MANRIFCVLVAVSVVVVLSNFDRTSSMPNNGLISVQSRVSAHETLNRLLAALAARKLTVFARVDHTTGAASVGLPLRPTEVVIFGNPMGGTALMQDQQSAGIDLPVKALVWEDADGKAWLTYNDPAWIAQRHGLGAASAAAVKAMAALLSAIAQEATQ
jgi:uncharacterized protein (DUF302 family)